MADQNTTIHVFEGPCSRVRLVTLALHETDSAQTILSGVYCQQYWREVAEEIPLEIGPSYRVTIEAMAPVQEEA